MVDKKTATIRNEYAFTMEPVVTVTTARASTGSSVAENP